MSSEFQFDDFRLDVAQVSFSRKQEKIHLTPKAFEVLHCLLVHGGRVVTREQLLAEVWPDVVVSDSALAATIRELRKALGDDAKTPRYIETLHRRGYRFIGQLSSDEPVPAATGRAVFEPYLPKYWRYGFAVILIFIISGISLFFLREPARQAFTASEASLSYPLPEVPSVVVLPFANLSGDPEQDYLVDGITDSLRITLAKIPELFVIARHSSATFKGKSISVQQVAQDLGVRYVLEGSVQWAGNRVRINTQLIDAVSGHHLWAEDYDREFNDIFDLQDSIVQQIMLELEVKLTDGEMAHVMRRSTNNPEAYQYVLQGNVLLEHFAEVETAQARLLFEKAVALDPEYASGWIFLGHALALQQRHGWHKGITNENINAITQKALALDPANPELYILLGANQMDHHSNLAKAIELTKKAVELNPNYADALAVLGIRLMYAGQAKEALAKINKAMRLSPYYPGWYLWGMGESHRQLKQYDQAIAALEKWRDRNPRGTHITLAYTYAEAGQLEKARTVVAEILKNTPDYTITQMAQFRHFWKPDVLASTLEFAREAGLPE